MSENGPVPDERWKRQIVPRARINKTSGTWPFEFSLCPAPNYTPPCSPRPTNNMDSSGRTQDRSREHMSGVSRGHLEIAKSGVFHRHVVVVRVEDVTLEDSMDIVIMRGNQAQRGVLPRVPPVSLDANGHLLTYSRP